MGQAFSLLAVKELICTSPVDVGTWASCPLANAPRNAPHDCCSSAIKPFAPPSEIVLSTFM